MCPITHEIFIEPVIGSDCHTYERSTIIDWLEKKEISPITFEPMSIVSLRSNLAMKKLIEELFQFIEINTNNQPPPIPPRQSKIPPTNNNQLKNSSNNDEDDIETAVF